MDEMQPIEMRRRIRELLSIPDRDRTDAEWDELNELEIRTAPGNRDYDRPQERQGDRRPGGMGQPGQQGRRQDRNPKQGNKNNNNPQRQPMQQEGRPEGRLMKRQHRRPKRPGQGGPGDNPANAANGGAVSSEGGSQATVTPPASGENGDS
jgi:hypothetical protein